jgi:hypothetical protein
MNKLSTQNGLAVAVRRLVLPWFVSSVQVPRWLFVLMWVALLACFWGFNFNSADRDEFQLREHHTPITNPSGQTVKPHQFYSKDASDLHRREKRNLFEQ